MVHSEEFSVMPLKIIESNHFPAPGKVDDEKQAAELQEWGTRHSADLSQILSDMQTVVNELIEGRFDVLRLTVLFTAPVEIIDGMVVYADGTSFNPGSGRGTYERVSGAWVKL